MRCAMRLLNEGFKIKLFFFLKKGFIKNIRFFGKAFFFKERFCSAGVVRPSMRASRAHDRGSNPRRSM